MSSPPVLARHAADLRATARVPAILPVQLVVPAVGGEVVAAETVDISPAGAGIVARGDWPVGTVVRFRGTVPGRRRPVEIDVEATIRWRALVSSDHTVLARDRIRYGLEFAALAAREEQEILAAVLFLETHGH